MVSILVTSPFAAAKGYTSFEQELDFDAIGSADEVQNAWDPTAQSNYDTWDPVPAGVWYGGWPVESKVRSNEVPDDDFSIALATVCMFGPNIIMSGAARTLVRLPIHTSDDPWTAAALNIYKVSEDSNWTFVRNISAGDSTGYALNDMKVKFTEGTHELIFWSQLYNASDASPTDGNDHFTRSERTYAFVDAPLVPDVFYLFITYAWYASDKYVDFYAQPDTLTEGEWNRSTIATYNEEAPDVYNLGVYNFTESFGYSFDFRHGFGNSAYGLNVWAEDGDEFRFFSYVNLSQVDDSHHMTFMIPFRTTTTNISWDVTIYSVQNTGVTSLVFTWADYLTRDFILTSQTHTWANNATGADTGWFLVKLTINNDTRLRLPLWDIPIPGGAPLVNDTWGFHPMIYVEDSDYFFSYNLGQWIQHTSDAGNYNYFWQVQHSIQFNDYVWQKVVTTSAGSDPNDIVDEMSFGQKVFYGFGTMLIWVGNVLIVANIPGGEAIRSAGVYAQIAAQYADFPDWTGRIWDTLVDAFSGIGTWLWRAAQAIKGFLEVVLDLLTWALGIIILFLAIGLGAFCLWITWSFFMAFRKAMLGDIEGAKAEVSGVVTTVKGAVVK